MTWLNGDLWTARPSPNTDGPKRLGIDRDLSFDQIEQVILAHAASADI